MEGKRDLSYFLAGSQFYYFLISHATVCSKMARVNLCSAGKSPPSQASRRGTRPETPFR